MARELVPLESARRKWERAQEHARTVGGLTEGFLATDPYGAKWEAEPGNRIWHARVVRLEPPPPELAVIAGDCLFDLRCALDHAVYELSARHTGQSPPPKAHQLEFPICLTRETWEEERTVRKVAHVSPAIRERIEAHQPINRPPPERDRLWLLHELNNHDKHRVLSVVNSLMDTGRFFGTAELVSVEPFFGPLAVESTLVTYKFVDPYDDPDMLVHAYVKTRIDDGLGAASPLAKMDLDTFLQLLVIEVNAVLFDLELTDWRNP